MGLSNPLLNEKTFAPSNWGGAEGSILNQLTPSTGMTIAGTANKTVFLFGLCLLAATGSWIGIDKGAPMMPIVAGGAILALVLSIVLAFKPLLAKWLAAPFALAEGAFLAGVSWMFDQRFGNGIVLNAVLITFGVFGGALLAYRLGWIRMGKTAMAIMTMGIAGISLAYIVALVSNLAGFNFMNPIHQGGPIGLAFSAIAIVVSVMTLIHAIQVVDDGAQSGAPKEFEWVGAFGLLSSLAWLYLEVLRLLGKLQSRD